MAARTRSARYDSPAKESGNASGKIVAVLAVIVAVIAVVVIWQYFQARQSITISATPGGFERTNDTTLLLNVDVTRKNTDVDSYCIVTAQNYNVEEVGRREFIIPAGGPKVQRFQVEIPSREMPVAGRVYGCSENPPHYLTDLARP
ncbi:DUF4307 domain-containing protein [Corynebacterium aquilae]|uniref:DUF4307 domain-containing protein n=1 Tax=Corynebacterium aquilae DSM 44791 TaxID=1431546 RepID=A0A1L7CEZ1_9CORY|nr:DUF4307 domain-containing protein [Corynebacterium aquilae]APT84432.1 hypothetical protein CAQU_04400 [Corynebacterium aquilae DSM 44791]